MKILQRLKDKQTIGKIKTGAIVLFLIIVAVSAIVFTFTRIGDYAAARTREASLYNNNEYDIVFLNSNLFYFCKLEEFNSEYIKCNDPYYLVRKKEDQADGTKQEKVYVTKPSDEEIYQPEGAIYLAKQNIVYIAKIGDKSAVMDYINKQK